MAAFTDDEEVLQVLVAYIEHQDHEIALEKLRYADAELEIRDLKKLLRTRTAEVETLQQQCRLKESRSRRSLVIESQAGRETMANYCQELERIIEVLEERLSCDQQARTLQETQAKLEEALCYAGELEERLIQSTRKWEERASGSPLRTDRIAPAVLESLSSSPSRWRPRRSVGTQARAESCACGGRQAWQEEKGAGSSWEEEEEGEDVRSPPPAAAAMRRASVELSEARKTLEDRDSEIRRLSSELAQFKSLYKDSSAQVEDLRLLLRRAFYDQGHVFDASLDDDLTISSTDSRRFMSKRWLTGKVQELRKRLPKLKQTTVHPVAGPEYELGSMEDEDSSSGGTPRRT